MQNYKEDSTLQNSGFSVLRADKSSSRISKSMKLASGVLVISAVAATAAYCLQAQQLLLQDQARIQTFGKDFDQEIMGAYVNFLAKYQKTYASKEEASNRYDVFRKNYENIKHHNSLESVPFTLEINKFADISDEEFEWKINGIQLPIKRSADVKPIQPHHSKFLSSGSYPESVNWYTAGKVSRPYNQMSCGACWAFTAVAAMESLNAIFGTDTTVQEYSVQQLVDCDDLDFACQGGWMWQGFNYTKYNGIALKSAYSRQYIGKKATCTYTSTQAYFKPTNLGMIEQDSNTNEQMKELVAVQPIAIAMFATGMLARFKNGVATEDFLKCSSPLREVNHGVTLVGYGKVDKNDRVRGQCKEYWIIRNSWGEDWGEEGFFRLCMDGVGDSDKPLGACLVNKFATWPNLEGVIIEPI